MLTSKPVQHLYENVLWFIVGEGTKDKRFTLGSVFRVSEVGQVGDDSFKHFAEGQGHVFKPPIPLDDLEWFQEVKRSTAHFSLGVTEIKDERIISGLLSLASEKGFVLADEP